MNINESVDVISSFEALHCESSCNLDELHRFATVELLKKEENPLKRDNKRRSCFQVSVV